MQLNPVTAVRFRGQSLDSTVYAGDRLLIRPSENEEAVLAELAAAAAEVGLNISVDPIDRRLRRMARQAGIPVSEAQPLLARIRLTPQWTDQPLPPPDAWPVLQLFRARLRPSDPDRNSVQLDHLLTSGNGPGITGVPYWKVPGVEGAPYWKVPGGGGGLGEYAEAGWGGRTPVAWVGPPPLRCPEDWMKGRRRPVVAVLDTGVGEHPWLPQAIVDRRPLCGTLRIGLTDPATDPEVTGAISDALNGGLDIDAGHGTFIAGLVRQKCPDANLLSIRVIQGDGVVSEGDLLEALNMLWLRQKLAIIHNRPDQLVDVISLSLGYYHEQPADARFDPLLLTPLRALGALGVAVIASAGNDATTRPMFPAAFAPHQHGLVKRNEPGVLPIVSVGALNPDGTVAMFSNEGPWIRVHRPGAALVSTLPTTFDASREPSRESVYRGEVRATIDPDDFSSGFGIWSGTSFAAPILAGEIAEWLNTGSRLPADAVDSDLALDRGWDALRHFVPRLRRPT
jgi:subtilisin family serine protease